MEIVRLELITDHAAALRELEAYRLQEGLSYTDMAAALGIGYQRYWSWRNANGADRVVIMRHVYGIQSEMFPSKEQRHA